MNKRGVALILAYSVIAILTVFGSIYVSRGVSESNLLRRYADSVQAFWIAEAGIADAFSKYQAGADEWDIDIGGGTCNVVVEDIIDADDPPPRREIRASATRGSGQTDLKAHLVYIPHPFLNTISAGDDLALAGFLASLTVHDKTRISGEFTKSGFGASGTFDDLQEGVDPAETTIFIPDFSGNGTADEFDDFVLFGQEVVTDYPAEEVVYIVSDDTVNIFPSSELIGKKIVFVEGSGPGTGNVNIYFDATWQPGQDLTVISTGAINYVQPLSDPEASRLSTISWGSYDEFSIFTSEHESVIYAHDDANFADILEIGTTTGNIIASDDVTFSEALTLQEVFFSHRSKDGDLAPGFEYLTSISDYLVPKLSGWQEE
ncbi:hypothetical protein ACFL1D_04270 [Candidatus Omnitrophota bacterium]